MIGEFNDLCEEAQKIDQSELNTQDTHHNDRVFDVDIGNECDVRDDETSTFVVNQCMWCGFSDHTIKTRIKYPQHPDYDGDKYQKISDHLDGRLARPYLFL